ncbi:MAG: protein kinase [Simkaniaceae bacterium]|nr:protein kinase [Simkaniaceae bacterium]
MAEERFYTQETQPVLTRRHEALEAIPKQIGPYPIESLLSRGGMSLLYLGRLPDTGQTIVVKILSPEYTSHPDVVAHFLKESEIIALTDHPNIIKLYGQGTWEKGLYISMEFVQGISLKQFINQQTLSLKSILDFTLQVSYALLHLHTHGVIHRDLKPENILITDQGQVKVIDFGIAQLVFDKTGSFFQGLGQFLGTPSYMSPEQKVNPLEVTPATDIYSLGVILYELITGRLSYGTIQLSLIPKGLRRIVKKCLEPALVDRYDDIVDFITDLTHYLRSEALQQDRSGSEEIKEVLAEISQTHYKLVPLAPPKWPSIDMGLALAKKEVALSLFYDFIRLANNHYLIYFGECPSNHVDSIAYIGYFKGVLASLIHKYRVGIEGVCDLDPLINTISATLVEGKVAPPLSLSLMYVVPGSEQFQLVSCGMPSPLHMSYQAAAPRPLQSNNPRLGETRSTQYSKMVNSWVESDILIFHTFRDEDIPNLEGTLGQAVAEFKHLNPQTQAESLYRRLISLSNFSPDTCPRALLIIQRIT